MWNWGHLRWALKCQLIQITLENVITYYCCCVTMWFFFWHFEFRSMVSHLNCVGTRWPNWPLWPVCLVKQDLQTVSALPPWGPMIQLLQLCTSLWVSGRHWFWSNVHFLMIKKMYQNSVSALCVCVCVSLQVTLSRWTSAPFTTMTPFSVTQSRCSATVSMEMYRLTARGSGGLALPDTICQVCHHFPNLSDCGDGAGGGSVAPVLHGVHTCFY